MKKFLLILLLLFSVHGAWAEETNQIPKDEYDDEMLYQMMDVSRYHNIDEDILAGPPYGDDNIDKGIIVDPTSGYNFDQGILVPKLF